MKKRNKRLIVALFILVLLGIGSWIGWQQIHYPPIGEAVKAVNNAEDKGTFFYYPGDVNKPLVIFYPGAFVDAESYSVWASGLAEAGYGVAIVKMPFDLAVLGENRGADVLKEMSQSSYVIGGHSLGGVMASRFAANEGDAFQQRLLGVYFFASYPDEKGSLKDTDLSVLSLIGSQDQIVNREHWTSAKAYLPNTAQFEEIESGTHAGFGTYGDQRGEAQTSLPNEKQQQMIVNQMTNWLTTRK